MRSPFSKQPPPLHWMPLDNAAKIYPAARRPNWTNVYRLSADLSEPVDVPTLQSALGTVVRRFPSMAARLRRGVFWYYLQELSAPPTVREEACYPLTYMSKAEARRCALRVIVYKNRVAVEIFHSLTDGNGALVFLKTLLAEYLERRYGVTVPATHGVLDRHDRPAPEELEDSFQKYSGALPASRREHTAWHLSGTPEQGAFLNLTCLHLPADATLAKAHEYGVSVTALLCAVMMMALQRWQAEVVPLRKKRKPVRVLIPVNLRRLYGSRTLRNFVMYTTPEILPQLGDYGFEEICRIVKSQMGLDITPKQMSMKIAVNVNSERLMAVRVMPLFIKNIVMKIIFNTVGECKSCLSLSNLGMVQLPEEMRPYVRRFDFILGVQASAPYNCGVLAYDNTIYVNFIRNICESPLERHFYEVLRELGLPVTAESNQREEDDDVLRELRR